MKVLESASISYIRNVVGILIPTQPGMAGTAVSDHPGVVLQQSDQDKRYFFRIHLYLRP